MSSTTSVEPSLSVTIGGSVNKSTKVNPFRLFTGTWIVSKRTPGFYFESRISKVEIFKEEIWKQKFLATGSFVKCTSENWKHSEMVMSLTYYSFSPWTTFRNGKLWKLNYLSSKCNSEWKNIFYWKEVKNLRAKLTSNQHSSSSIAIESRAYHGVSQSQKKLFLWWRTSVNSSWNEQFLRKWSCMLSLLTNSSEVIFILPELNAKLFETLEKIKIIPAFNSKFDLFIIEYLSSFKFYSNSSHSSWTCNAVSIFRDF